MYLSKIHFENRNNLEDVLTKCIAGKSGVVESGCVLVNTIIKIGSITSRSIRNYTNQYLN